MKVIGCDLFLDLDIFNVPKHFIDELKEKYIVKEVNTYNSDDTDISDIEIYFGNRSRTYSTSWFIATVIV